MGAQAGNPCLACGGCCSSFRVSFYHGEAEGMSFGMVPEHLVEKLSESRACMKGSNQKHPRCIALSGTPGVQAACTIYIRRRAANLMPGKKPNERCQKLRAGLGLAPLRPVDFSQAQK